MLGWMAQPFRDEYAAAVDRAEQLARENDELREEVARIRAGGAGSGASGETEPLDALKARTLQRLEDLSRQIQGDEPPAQVRVDASVTEAPMLPVVVDPARHPPNTPSAERAPTAPQHPLVTVDPQVRALTAEDRVKALEAERARLYLMLALSLLSASVLLVLWLLEVFR
jgi:hypothetical protein